jgi:hypothetical protein
MKNTAQHTPGPWQVSPHSNITSKSLVVAKVEQMPGNYESEKQANARLIASAPDMFDALQAVCDAYGDRDTLLMAQVKAALAKAKGGAA